MGINTISSTTFTSGLLITDTVTAPGGSNDSIPSLTINAGSPVDAALEIQSTTGAFLVPRVTTAQRDDMNVVDGMIIYNKDDGELNFRESGEWIAVPPASSGDVSVVPGGVTENDIPVFADTTGFVIRDSGVNINQVVGPIPHLLRGYNPEAPLIDVNQIGNLGHIQFVNDVGIVFVDALVPVEFITNDYGPGSQTCSLFTGGLPSASTNPSALVELQSTTGALLLSRMETSEASALFATSGMMYFDSTLNSYVLMNGSDPVLNGIRIGGQLFSTPGDNFFIGMAAGSANSSNGANNTGIGTSVLSSLDGGQGNTALGFYALLDTVDGNNNIAVGNLALSANISGSDNVIVGNKAAFDLTGLDHCTFIGGESGPGFDALTNAGSIGYASTCNVSSAFNIGNSCNVGINNPEPAYSLDIANVNDQNAIRLENTATLPTTPVAGSGIIYIRSEIPYFMDSAGEERSMISSGTPTYNTPQVLWVNSSNGDDSTADGSTDLPFLTIEAAAVFASASTSETNQYVLNLSGDFSISGAFTLFPFININGFYSSTINATGNVHLHGSWDSVLNPSIHVTGVTINSAGAHLQFTTYQNAAMIFDVDWGTTSSIQVTGSGTTEPEFILFYGGSNYPSDPHYFVENVLCFFENISAEQIVIESNSSALASATVIKNCQFIGSITASTPGTFGASLISIYGCPSINSIELQDAQTDLSMDCVSYTFEPTFIGGATIDNVVISSSSDGVAANISPSNFTPDVSSNFPSNSVTAMLLGIDNALAIGLNVPTRNNQIANVSQGYSQGCLGGGAVGSNIVMSANSTEVFDTAALNAQSTFFNGSVFDGRYLYMINTDARGQITRYDTYAPFTDNSSYDFYDTSLINFNSVGFYGGVFDGRYVYFAPTLNGQITRYDTTQRFQDSSSYEFFDTTTVNANSRGFYGAVIIGKYIYFIPGAIAAGYSAGQITRYDTTMDFSSAGSYSVFDTTTVNSNSKGFSTGVTDGRYLFLVPYYNGASFGQITQYDTSMDFNSSGSYSVFDTTVVNSNSKGFRNATFDGRFIYFPNQNVVTRYDTTFPFGNASSYEDMDISSFSAGGISGSVYDGKYIYFVINNSGVVIKYDITLPFTDLSSYSSFDTATVDPNSRGFYGAMYDGAYVYLIPYAFTGPTTMSGQITRLVAYSGPALAPSVSSTDSTNLFPFSFDSGNSSGVSDVVFVYGDYTADGDFVRANITLSYTPTSLIQTIAFIAPLVASGAFPIRLVASMTANVFQDGLGDVGSITLSGNLSSTNSLAVNILTNTTSISTYISLSFSYQYRNF